MSNIETVYDNQTTMSLVDALAICAHLSSVPESGWTEKDRQVLTAAKEMLNAYAMDRIGQIAVPVSGEPD